MELPSSSQVTNSASSTGNSSSDSDRQINYCNSASSDRQTGSVSYDQVVELIRTNYCIMGNTVKLTKAVWSVNKSGICCYGFKQGRLIGYLGVALFEIAYGNALSDATIVKIGYINFLCVDKDHRNQGLAKDMVIRLASQEQIPGYYLSEKAMGSFPMEQTNSSSIFSYPKKNWFRPVQPSRAKDLGYIWPIPKVVSARSRTGITSLEGYYKVNRTSQINMVRITTIDPRLYNYITQWNAPYTIYLNINGLNQLCKHFEVYLISQDNKPVGLVAGHVTPIQIKEGPWFNNFYLVYMLGQAEVSLNALMSHLSNIVCLYILEGGPIDSNVLERIKAYPTTNLSYLNLVRMTKPEGVDRINLPVF